MNKFDEILEAIVSAYCPLLSTVAASMINDDIALQEDEFAVDSFLQFTLLERIDLPDGLVDDIEAEVHAGWDPELTDRTLGWIAKHRERNAA